MKSTKKSKQPKKITILYSGGLDSFIMAKLAQDKYPDVELNLVHYDIGQPYNEKEMKAIQASKIPVEIRKIDWLKSESDLKSKGDNAAGNVMIPGRNLALATNAASAFLPDEVWMGGLKGEDNKGATDKNKKFIKLTNKVWSYVYSPYERVPKLVFPLVDQKWGKFEAVEWVYKNKLATAEEILQTSSCLSGEPGNCGECIVCFRRKYIFSQLGFSEEYNKDPLTITNINMVLEMLENEKEDDQSEVHYDKYRRREIIPGLVDELGCKKKNLGKVLKKMKAQDV